jgi:hypothetical protein
MMVALSGCIFGGGAPGKSEVQHALEQLAKDNPILFGDGVKPVVKDTKCTKVGNDIYDCATSLAVSNDPEAHTVTVRMTKLDGKWQAQITNMFSG